MSLFRRTFSRRLPDHLQEISQCIYVFDSCLSTATINETEFKSYLGRVVTSLHRFHPGASFMVFNFREGDQVSLLSDILIDYDMTVVDYPKNHEGYPLLPLEMINYFLRSSESWLSLSGQKNVILMHCEKGGWPVLAFMLAGLLLYRKQFSGEQKTLEMVYKQAPKQVFSVLTPINARASQLRYLNYITGRDSGSDWPPPDAPLVLNNLFLYNLPLFDGGKGCRPVVRVYGQDPLEKADRGPRLLISTLMAEDSAWLYPKDECIAVKLELRCKVQGDVFLECIHLYDDLVTEELIFKVMFHTGFVQSNFLALNSGDIDVPWNPKHQLPKDFKAEVLFRDINEAPQQITMELEIGEELRDSDNEFFEVEEIFTPLSSSPVKKLDLKILNDQNASILETKSRDCTLHNGAPRWDLETEVSALSASKDIVFDGGNVKKASEILHHINDLVVTEVIPSEERDIGGQPKQSSEKEAVEENNKHALGKDTVIIESKNPVTDYRNSEQASGLESDINASKNIVMVDDRIHKQAPQNESDISAATLESEPAVIASKSNVIVDDRIHKQALEKESDISAPNLGSESGIVASRNIVIIDDRTHNQVSEKESEFIIPASGSESGIIASRNIVMDDDMINKEKEVGINAPISGSESSITLSKNIVIENDWNYNQASGKGSDMGPHISAVESGTASKNIMMDDDRIQKSAPISETISTVVVPKNIMVDHWNHNGAPTSGLKSSIIAPTSALESGSTASNNIVMFDDRDYEPASEKNSEISAPASGLDSDMIVSSENIIMAEDRIHEKASKIKSVIVAAPTSELESRPITLQNIAMLDDRVYKPASEKESKMSAPSSGVDSDLIVSNNIVLVDDKINTQSLEIRASENIVVVDTWNLKEDSETKSEAETNEGRDIKPEGAEFHTSALELFEVDDTTHIQAPESSISVSKIIVQVDDMYRKQDSEKVADITSSENIVVDVRIHKETSETQSGVEADQGHDIQASASEEEFVTNVSKNIIVDHSDHIQVLEKEVDISALSLVSESGISASKNIALVGNMYHEQVLETKSGINASENIIVVDIENHKEALGTQSKAEVGEGHGIRDLGAEFVPSVLKSIVAIDSNNIQAPEKEMDVTLTTGEESGISVSKNVVMVDIYRKQDSDKEASEIQFEAEADKGHEKTDFVTSVSKSIMVDDSQDNQALEKEVDVSESKNIVLVEDRNKQASDTELDISATNTIAMSGIKNAKEASETQSDIYATNNNMVIVDRNHKQASDIKPQVIASKNIVVVDDGSQIQEVKVEIEPKFVPSSSKTKQNKRNKWQEMTAKTITQQRVVSQWVPRTKQQAPEPTKPKPTTYKWVQKGATTPTAEK